VFGSRKLWAKKRHIGAMPASCTPHHPRNLSSAFTSSLNRPTTPSTAAPTCSPCGPAGLAETSACTLHVHEQTARMSCSPIKRCPSHCWCAVPPVDLAPRILLYRCLVLKDDSRCKEHLFPPAACWGAGGTEYVNHDPQCLGGGVSRLVPYISMKTALRTH
jgi:hypothetical protein